MNRNDRWIQRHFGQLMDLYGGRFVAVSGDRVVGVGASPGDAERRARQAGCKGCPSVLRVPDLKKAGGAVDPVRLFRLS